MLIFVILKFFFSSTCISFHFVFTSVEILFYNEYILLIMCFLLLKIARDFGACIFARYLKILARVFDAMMLTNCFSGLPWSTNLNLGSGRKSDEIMEKLGIRNWLVTLYMVAFELRHEANDTENLTRVPIQKEALPRGPNYFLSSVVFWNRCTLSSN